MFGVGIGNSVQVAGYLPESLNDSVFAVIGEMFGFLGLTVVVMVFVWLLMEMFKVGEKLSDDMERLVVFGIFGWVAAHAIINMAAMSGLIALTGITLPFLSLGGTSILFTAAGLGIVFQLSRQTNREVVKQ
jgi:cell division protein FtsW